MIASFWSLVRIEFILDDSNEEILMNVLLIEVWAELKESTRGHPERHSSRELIPLRVKETKGGNNITGAQ